jgi:hypothetical protein
VNNLYSALPSLLRLSLGSDHAHPYTTEKVPLPDEALAPPVPAVPVPLTYAFPWPDRLPGLGPRRVGPFTDCQDCIEAPAWPIRIVRLDTKPPVHVVVRVDRGTWVCYGARALCLPCVRRRVRGATL